MADKRLKIGVLISGGGTTLVNLAQSIRKYALSAEIGLVIASRADIAGIVRADEFSLDCRILDRRQFTSIDDFSREIFARCAAAGIELVCLAGWLSLLRVSPGWIGRIMNIHPALLPAFGGAGMYGARVHQAVLNHGCKISGCTVHFVDDTYDNGPIVLQRSCAVRDNDTPATLAARVFEEEKIAYPQAIELFAQGRLIIDGRHVRIR